MSSRVVGDRTRRAHRAHRARMGVANPAQAGEDCAGPCAGSYATLPTDCIHHAHVTRYSTPATNAMFFKASAPKEEKKGRDDVVVCCAGRRVRIRCAANRTTSGYALTFLWPLTERGAFRSPRAYIVRR